MGLEVEIAEYERRLPELLASDEGRYALFVGPELVGIFDNQDDAWMVGFERNRKGFLLRKIERTRQVVHMMLRPSFITREKI